MLKYSFLVGFWLLITVAVCAQSVDGVVKDDDGQPVEGVAVVIKGSQKGTITNQDGRFQIKIDSTLTLTFQHVAYQVHEQEVTPQSKNLSIELIAKTEYLQGVEVKGRSQEEQVSPSITKLDPLSVESLPSPFGDFTRILATLPGVVSNNELSSTYSVRGGNFDENLIYVNNIPIYRPQLITAGQQEGLGFVNTSLVEDVTFSAGGWGAKYGDKLSSVLDVKYKQPKDFHASATLGLLGGQLHIENQTKNERISYLAGIRHKRAEYLLNSLETKGEYLPRFTDFQGLVNINLGPENDPERTKLSILGSYARNRYRIAPANRETEFGTFNQSFRLFVAFIGQELMEYDTYQGGMNLTHRIKSNWSSNVMISAVNSAEREFKDVEGGYRLCDLDTDINSRTFKQCLITRGIGTNFEYSRNILKANIINLENSHRLEVSNKSTLEFGIGAALQEFDDQFSEYSFRDSSGYIISLKSVDMDNRIRNDQYYTYIQNTTEISSRSTVNVGVRALYSALNGQLAISPRAQYSYAPDWQRDVLFKVAAGIYYQAPFFRELRDFNGVIHLGTDFQKSLHLIAGMDYRLKIWNRDFTLFSEVYYKDISNAIAYDVDNVRIRYYPTVEASAFATGFDIRLSGEFIPGTVSWFSLGILSTKEKVDGIDQQLRRPSDQRLNLGIFFQDHLPNDPTWRVNLNLQVGTGLPFGPPNNFKNRATFTGPAYRRVDVGFTKEIDMSKIGDLPKLLIGAEILNLLGVNNTISYTWIEDVVGQEFAIPNGLSTRFLNLKVTLKI